MLVLSKNTPAKPPRLNHRASQFREEDEAVRTENGPVPPRRVQPPGAPETPVQPAAATKESQQPYIRRGNWELGVSGLATIPHANASATTGDAILDVGYYVARHSLVGAEFSVLAIGSDLQLYNFAGRYRFLFHTGNPRFFPFVGVAPGASITHVPGITETDFTLRGEVGIKYFVAQHVSFETAYNLQYVHISGADFKESTASVVTFGLSFTF